MWTRSLNHQNNDQYGSATMDTVNLSLLVHACCQIISDALLTKSNSQESMKIEVHSDALLGDKVRKVRSSREDS